MADQEMLLSLLRAGRVAWNRFRADHPDEKIEFADVDFTDAVANPVSEPVLAGPVMTVYLNGYDLQQARFFNCIMGGPLFASASLIEARLDRCQLLGPDFGGASLNGAEFNECRLWHGFRRTSFSRLRAAGWIDLDDCHFEDCDFSEARLGFAFLSNTGFLECNLRNARVDFAYLNGTSFRRSSLEGLCIGSAMLNRRRSRNAYDQVTGIEAIHGDPNWVRQAREDFFTSRQMTRLSLHRPPAYLSPTSPIWLDNLYGQFRSLFGGFANWRTWLAIGLVFAIGAWIADPGTLGKVILPWPKIGGQSFTLPGIAIAAVVGAVLGGLQAGWYGRVLWSWLWKLFDYGRDWDRVAIFAMALIALLGWLYGLAAPDHLDLKGMADGAPDHPFLPWFVATMGFCTLGLSDYAQPRDGVGMLLMMANVIAGFATLGLTLAVIQEKFSRGFSQ